MQIKRMDEEIITTVAKAPEILYKNAYDANYI